MDADSGDDDKDGLTSEWGSERETRLVRPTKWIWKLIQKTGWCIP